MPDDRYFDYKSYALSGFYILRIKHIEADNFKVE